MTRHLLALLTATLVAVVACAVSVVGLWGPFGSPPPGAAPVAVRSVAPPPAATGPARVPEAVEVLRSWDARRSRAWARGDPVALAALYVPGSAAGAHDAAMLRAWASRGLRVAGLSTQLLAVDTLGRSASRWRLRVTDRIAAGSAVGRGRVRPLPADRASTRTVVLQRWHDGWRVASVTTSAPDTS